MPEPTPDVPDQRPDQRHDHSSDHRPDHDLFPALFAVLSTSRAMRRLRPDPVPDALVRRLIGAANCAPSGRNLQRARWIVVSDAGQRRRIGELNRRASLDHATAERDAATDLPHHDREKRQRMWDAVLWQADHLHEAPVIVVACCIMDDAAQDPGRYASSIWPGVQNLLLAARARQVSGRCPRRTRWRSATSSRQPSRCPTTCAPRRSSRSGSRSGGSGPCGAWRSTT
jgi:nitroreductase